MCRMYQAGKVQNIDFIAKAMLVLMLNEVHITCRIILPVISTNGLIPRSSATLRPILLAAEQES